MTNVIEIEAPKPRARVAGIDSGRLESFLDRMERLETERREHADLIKDLKTEVKSAGFDPSVLMAIVKRRMEDDSKRAKRRDKEELLALYMRALGEFADTPLAMAMAPR